MKRAWGALLVVVLAWVLAIPGAARAVGGPRTLDVTAASCPAAKELATKKATEACAKHGGLAWTEFSLDCEADTELLPGVPVNLQVHFLCGSDL